MRELSLTSCEQHIKDHSHGPDVDGYRLSVGLEEDLGWPEAGSPGPGGVEVREREAGAAD